MNQSHSPPWKFRNRPFSGVFARSRRNQVIRLALQAQETEDRSQGSEPDAPLAQPTRIQPGFVELQTRGQEVGDTLMKAGDEQASHRSIGHTLRCGIERGLPPGVREDDRIGGPERSEAV